MSSNAPPPSEGADEILSPPTPPKAPVPLSLVFPRIGPELFAAIRGTHAQKVVLQVPAGLTRNAHHLAAEITEKTGAAVLLASRACFGACDFPSESEAPGAELAVVLGHSPIPNVRLARPTFFVEMREAGGDAARLVSILLAADVPRRLGLVSSIQHLDLVPKLVEALVAHGFDVRMASGGPRLFYPAQALGCNYTTAEAVAADVDAFLFLGTGRFHPLGLALAVDRPVWSLDPLQNLLEPPLDRAGMIRKRLLLVASVRDARRWGVLVSSFAGQDRHPMATSLVRHAVARGREAHVLVFDRLDPRDLEGRDLDAYVNTACPRIALDDGGLYPRPMLTPPEFLMALGEIPLEPYRFDTYR
ncbi:MAG: diphthamide biosynthesis enzyme Dph2 [Thermoplasmata archaeon]|nr:diphthamide biosynthesis enzyme Dph2 [Thermoplasmata archaeon]